MDAYKQQLELEFGDLLTVQDAAAALTLAVVTIRKWMAESKISYVRLGRAVRIPGSELRRVLEAGLVRRQP